MSTKTRAERLAEALLMGKAMIPEIDLPEAAEELRRQSASEAALLEALGACLSLLECHEHTPNREPLSAEPDCMSNARALIARTKEARNG